MIDLLILWRNELLRPEAQRSAELLAAFALKIRASVAALDREADAIAGAPFGIGHIAIGCALGYLDFRFADMSWRDGHARISRWFEAFGARPSVRLTLPSVNPQGFNLLAKSVPDEQTRQRILVYHPLRLFRF